MEAYQFLKEKVKYGEREESRPYAIAAFASTVIMSNFSVTIFKAFRLDSIYKKEATDILISILLRDHDYGVPRNIFSSVHGLRKLKSGFSAIEAAKSRVAPQVGDNYE